MNYLRSLTDAQLNDYVQRETIGERLITMGAQRTGGGVFSECYAIDGFVIKISSQDLSRLREFRHNPVFKKFVAPVYWIHQTGKALLCKLIEFIRSETSEQHSSVRQRFERKLLRAGMAAEDLHIHNLVKVKGTRRYLVIDYGCVVGN